MRQKDGIKQCSRCKVTKPVSDFGSNAGTYDCLKDWCKQCTNTYNKNRRIKDPIRYWTQRYKSLVKTYKKDYSTYDLKKKKYMCSMISNAAKKAGIKSIAKCDKPGCGSGINVQLHHPDYSKPTWMIARCMIHHQEIHNKKREKLGIVVDRSHTWWTPEMHNRILALWADGMTQMDIMRNTGVPNSTVSKIVRGLSHPRFN